MIVVKKGTELTYANLNSWIQEWERDKARLQSLHEMYKNRKDGKHVVKLPFAKKLVLISSAASVGEGVTLSAPDLTGTQKATFEEIKRLFEVQTIISQDRDVIKSACIFGRGYEQVYMSSDEAPIPKTAKQSALNAFVVFDNTVEHNSLYGVCFERYTDKGIKRIAVSVYDAYNVYESDLAESDLASGGGKMLEASLPHVFGRVPLTEFRNNEEEQGDFEQVVDLILDRSEIHDLNLKDFKAIAKNYLKARNIELAGTTDKEKNESQDKMASNQRIEVKTDNGVTPDAADDISLLSKNENYLSITEFGGDVDDKIYDLSMIPNLSDEQFAGNQSGVALKLKLFAFKQLVSDKDVEIEKLYRRRIKMYMAALVAKGGYEAFDISNVKIQINRNWAEVLTEIATIIAQLQPTGLFSDRFLINLMPEADYDEEKAQKETEDEEKRQAAANNPDPNNQSAEWLASQMSALMGAGKAKEDVNGGTA